MTYYFKNTTIPLVRVMSREQVEQLTFQMTHNISITSSKRNAEIENLDGKVLFLEFDDTIYEEKGVITKSQAEEITKFVKANWNPNEFQFVINCDAGVSRSAGVAAAILQYYFNDASQIWEDDTYCPNEYVCGMVLNALKEVE